MKQNLMIASTIALIAAGGFAVAQSTADTPPEQPVIEGQADTDMPEANERRGERGDRDGKRGDRDGKRGGGCDRDGDRHDDDHDDDDMMEDATTPVLPIDETAPTSDA